MSGCSFRQSAIRYSILLLMSFATFGCSENTQSGRNQQRMFVSTKNFQTGLSDGRRDAKASWTEDGGYWMWLWMTDEQYQTGYEQGWKQGRQELNYERQQNKSERIDQERESSEEAPPIGE